MSEDDSQESKHVARITIHVILKEIHIQSGPKKCIHSLLINIFGINFNKISVSGWEFNIIYNSRTSLISILLLYKYSSYDYVVIFFMSKCVYISLADPVYIYTGCNRRNVRDLGRVFLMLNYTDITQNTYIQSWTVTEIMAIEMCGF